MMETDRLETAATCLERLGRPPADIAERWLEDAHQEIDRFTAIEFDATDPVWDSLLVDASGRLLAGPELTKSLPLTSTRIRGQTPAKRDRGKPGRGKSLVLGGIAVLLITAITIPLLRTTDSELPTTQNMSSATSPDPSNPFSLDFDDARSSRPSSTDSHSAESTADDAIQLETIQGDSTPPGDFTAQGSESLSGAFTLSELMPPADVPATSQPTTYFPTEQPESATNAEQPFLALEDETGIDISETKSDGETLENAVPRETRAATPLRPKTTAVSLPRPPSSASSELPPECPVLLSASPPKRLRLEFPSPTSLSLIEDAGGARWKVISGKVAEPIAVLQWQTNLADEDTSGLGFRWLPAASRTNRAVSLGDGRLVTGDGSTVYLRAQLDAEPIVLSLASKDEKLKWNLGVPVASGVTELSLAIETPDDVQWRWIEPFEKNSVRDTRGIAMLNLKDSPDAGALVVRLDIRSTSTLSIRVRFGGRLDPKLPWQWTDAKIIRNSLDAVTGQLGLADEQLLRLDAAISRAKKVRARRQADALDRQRERIEGSVAGATVLAKRLAELDQLVALLDADGRITASLNVRWPHGETQALLNLRAR